MNASFEVKDCGNAFWIRGDATLDVPSNCDHEWAAELAKGAHELILEILKTAQEKINKGRQTPMEEMLDDIDPEEKRRKQEW